MTQETHEYWKAGGDIEYFNTYMNTWVKVPTYIAYQKRYDSQLDIKLSATLQYRISVNTDLGI